jgi:hypothetical protein
MKILITNLDKDSFDLPAALKCGAWGCKLGSNNCHDLWKYGQMIKYMPKVVENTFTCMKKIVCLNFCANVEFQKDLINLALPRGLFVFGPAKSTRNVCGPLQRKQLHVIVSELYASFETIYPKDVAVHVDCHSESSPKELWKTLSILTYFIFLVSND